MTYAPINDLDDTERRIHEGYVTATHVVGRMRSMKTRIETLETALRTLSSKDAETAAFVEGVLSGTSCCMTCGGWLERVGDEHRCRACKRYVLPR